MTDAELLHHGPEGDPWRPSRRLVAVAAVVAVLAAGVTGAVAWQRHERTLDARAAAAVDLLVGTADAGDHALTLQLLNAGTDPVRLLGVQLDAPGYPEGRLATTLAPHSDGTVRVPTGTACDRRLLTAPPQGLLVRLRTSRGTVVERTVAFQADTASSVGDLERSRCGFVAPDVALSLEPSSVNTVGRAVIVKTYLSNSSNVPLTVEDLTAVPGLEVTAPLPLTVPGNLDGATNVTLTTLRLTVLDCARFAVSVDVGPGAQQPDVLMARVRSAYGAATVALELTQLAGGPGNGPDLQPLVPLLAQCPGLTVSPTGSG